MVSQAAVADAPFPARWRLGRVILGLGLFGLLSFLSLFAALGAWPLVALIVGMTALFALLLSGPDRIAMLWLVGIPTVFTFANNFAQAIPAFTVDRLLFLVLIGLIVGAHVFRRRPLLRMDGIESISLLFLALLSLSFMIFSVRTGGASVMADGAMLFTAYVMPLGTYAIVRRGDWSDKRVRFIMWGLAVTGGFLGAVGTLQFLTGTTMFNATYMELTYENGHFERAIGTFAGPWEYGAATALLSLVCLFCYTSARSLSGRLMALFLLAISLAGLGLGQTRAAYLSFVIGFALYAWLDARLRPTLIATSIAGSMAAALAFPFLVVSGFFDGRLLEISPIFNRLALWATSGNMIVHNPLFGIGFGAKSFAAQARDYLTGFGDVGANWVVGVSVPHNELIHLAVLAGLPAAILVVMLIVRSTRRLKTIVRTQTGLTRDIAVFALVALSVLVVNAMFADLGLGKWIAIPTFFLVAIAVQRSEALPEDPKVRR